MAEPIRLEEWAVVFTSNDPWQPPEMQSVGLIGKTPDGEVVLEHGKAKVEGRIVTTPSGSVYRLGEPKPEYREWLKVNRPNWDPENPLKAS